MRRRILAVSACLVLAACGSSDADTDGDGKVSIEEAAKKADAEMIRPEPGRYRADAELVELDMPGAPEQIRDLIRQQMAAGNQTSEFCLTAEDAEKGFEEMARESQQNDDCSFEKFDVDGGDIDAVMVCEIPGQGKARIEVAGTGTSTSSEMTMKMDASGPAGQKMVVTTRTKQERIGDC